MTRLNGRTGEVFLEDFDIGIVESVGAELIEIELDGELAPEYAIRFDGVTGPIENPPGYSGMTPVVFQEPEDVFQGGYLPHLVISRSDITPDLIRWFPGGHEYRIPASVAEMVTSPTTGAVGPTMVEMKQWTLPFNLQYDLHLRGKRRFDVDRMFRQVVKRLGGFPYGQVFVKDSEGDIRGYHAFLETASKLDEVVEIGDRTLGHTLSVRVEAELDFTDPYLVKTVTGIDVSVFTRARGLNGGA